MAAVDLWRILRWEAAGAMDGDVSDYFFVARGILNGLTPYVDLYESKPPGIFFLSALSLLVTGDQRFLSVLQWIMLGAIPFLFAAFALHVERKRHSGVLDQTAAGLLGLVVGILFTLFLEERGGMLQTEGWGSFLGLLYLLSIAWDGAFTTRRMWISGAFLFGTIFMKEPFLLAALAGALVLCPTWQSFKRSFVIPLLGAGAAFVIVMVAFGWLGPYLTIHLPAMLWGRIASDPIDPVWLRWLSIRWLWGNTTTYNKSAPLFGNLLILFFLSVPLMRRGAGRARDVVVAIAGPASALVFVFFTYFQLIFWNMRRVGVQSTDALMTLHDAIFLWWMIAVVVMAICSFLQWKRGYLRHLVPAVLALCLASQAAGISVYAINHFAFAFPFYVSLAILFLRHMRDSLWTEGFALAAVLLASIIAFTWNTDPVYMQQLEGRTQYTYAKNREQTDRLDALLTACDFDRYYAFGGLNRLQFAKHSHYGPMVNLAFINYLPLNHPLVMETVRNILLRTPVIVDFEKQQFLSPEIDATILQSFTDEIPPCAAPHLPIGTARVLFRKQRKELPHPKLLHSAADAPAIDRSDSPGLPRLLQ